MRHMKSVGKRLLLLLPLVMIAVLLAVWTFVPRTESPAPGLGSESPESGSVNEGTEAVRQPPPTPRRSWLSIGKREFVDDPAPKRKASFLLCRAGDELWMFLHDWLNLLLTDECPECWRTKARSENESHECAGCDSARLVLERERKV